MSAFFLYSQGNRSRIKEENPTASFGDIVSSKSSTMAWQTAWLTVFVMGMFVGLMGNVDFSANRHVLHGVGDVVCLAILCAVGCVQRILTARALSSNIANRDKTP